MSKTSRISGAVPVVAFAALVAAGLVACDGSGPSTTGPTALVPADSEPTVVLSQAIDDVEVGGQRMINFGVPRRGTLALRVRWNDQNNSVVAILTSTGCFNINNPVGDCRQRRSIERQGREGREGFIEDADAAGAYRLLIENEGPGVESIRVTAELTPAFVAPPPPTPHPYAPPDRSPTPRRSWEP